MLAANAWNVAQYAALVMMIAQVSGLKAGELVHVIADAHIYDRHIPIVKEIIEREQFDAPKVTLDPSITDFYSFTPESFKVENYVHGEKIGRFPIAV
jgi:thymidylate synthase